MIDLDQPAELRRRNGANIDGEGRRRFTFAPVGTGTLREMLALAAGQSNHDQSALSISIAGGFHLDGVEISDLAAQLAR